MTRTALWGGVEVTVTLNMRPGTGAGSITYGTPVTVDGRGFRVVGSMPELDESITFDLQPVDEPGSGSEEESNA